MQKLNKKIIKLSLVSAIIMFTILSSMTLNAFAATVTLKSDGTANFNNAQFYVLGSSSVPTYTSSSGTKVSGSIYANDLCKVIDATGTYWKISYPTSNGTKTAYCNRANILSNSNYCKKIGINANETVYKKSDMSTTFGTVYTTDTIYMLSPISNGKAQIIYNVSNGYKIGWIYANVVSPPQDKSVESRLNSLLSQYITGTTKYWTTNGKPSDSDGTTSKTYNGAIQCKGFAAYIFNELFNGGYIGSYDDKKYFIPSPKNATLLGKYYGNEMTESNIKKLFAKGRPGDFIQVRRRDKTYGHSMILVSQNSSGITVFDCNSDGKCGIMKYSQSYSTFISKNIGMSLYTSTNYR